MRRLIYIQPNGIIAIVHPVINTNEKDIITSASAETRAALRLTRKGIEAVWVDVNDIPADRTTRNTWALSATARGSHKIKDKSKKK